MKEIPRQNALKNRGRKWSTGQSAEKPPTRPTMRPMVDAKKIRLLVGIDEVGRGPLAGPVAVCACAMPYHGSVQGAYKNFLRKHEKDIKNGLIRSLDMKDSKKLSEKDREAWHERFRVSKSLPPAPVFFSYGTATAADIDSVGISRCISRLIESNLKKIIKKYQVEPEECLVLLDGSLKAPVVFAYQQTIIKGDEKELVISLASIYAKVTRDKHMKALSKRYEKYGFEVHKGYGTLMHRNLIKKHGLSPVHRKSFCKNLAIDL